MVVQEKILLELGIPVDKINVDARIEKLGHAKPPISLMHYFLTRKPLVIARMVIAGTLLGAKSIESPELFDRLIGIDPTLKKRAYKTFPFDLSNRIKKAFPEGVTILDPFAGSGMIPFEAVRMGLDVVALDYNPVAYLIMKGTIEYPLKYGSLVDKATNENKLLSDFGRYSNEIFSNLKNELRDFYPLHDSKQVRGYIHAWAVKCPTCGEETPLVNNWRLSTEEKIWINHVIRDGRLHYEIAEGDGEKEGNVYRGHATCLHCAARITNDQIISDISKHERETMLALYLDDGSFELPTIEDRLAIERAKEYLKKNQSSLSMFLPTEEIPDDKRSFPSRKYLAYWFRLFNPRQLLVLTILAREIKKTVEEIAKQDREYAAAIGTYLSMILAKHVDYNSRCTHWHSLNKQIGDSMAMRGLSMMWSHAETNPFVKFSGSLIGNIHDVREGLRFATEEMNRNVLLGTARKPKVEILNASILSWNSNRKFKFIITDPPYYDDVPYPELMQFFQVWHSRTIGDLLGMNSIPSTSEELSVGRDRDKETFENRMMVAIRKLFDLLEEDGILTMFYAHGSIEGWKYLLEALRKTGFRVTSTITLMTENEGNVITHGKSSVFHSLVLTARKRLEKRVANIVEVEKEIQRKIEERYLDLEKVYGKDRMNLMVAASGIVIEAITSYSEITSFTKNTAEYALEMGQRYLIEVFSKNLLNVEHIDVKTMVYIWFRNSMHDSIYFSEFNQTLKALGTSEEAVSDIIAKDISDGSKVRLIDFPERASLEIDGMEPLIAQSLIDAVHIALRAYMRGGITAAKEKISSSPFGSKPVLNTMTALAKIYSVKSNYSEGEICKRFLEEWKTVYGSGQQIFK